jgi:hypothetical protein
MMTDIERSGAVCEIKAHLLGARKRAIALTLDTGAREDDEPQLADRSFWLMSAILHALGAVEDLESTKKEIEHRRAQAKVLAESAEIEKRVADAR